MKTDEIVKLTRENIAAFLAENAGSRVGLSRAPSRYTRVAPTEVYSGWARCGTSARAASA